MFQIFKNNITDVYNKGTGITLLEIGRTFSMTFYFFSQLMNALKSLGIKTALYCTLRKKKTLNGIIHYNTLTTTF